MNIKNSQKYPLEEIQITGTSNRKNHQVRSFKHGNDNLSDKFVIV